MTRYTGLPCPVVSTSRSVGTPCRSKGQDGAGREERREGKQWMAGVRRRRGRRVSATWLGTARQR